MVSLHKVTIKGMSDEHKPDGRGGSESFSIRSGVNKKSLGFAFATLVAIIRTGQEMGLSISGLMKLFSARESQRVKDKVHEKIIFPYFSPFLPPRDLGADYVLSGNLCI